MKFLENIPLAPYTSFGIGGPAKFFCEAANKKELAEALYWAKGKSMPVFVLGSGSNILVSDTGFQGLVIKNQITGLNIEPAGDFTRALAGAGEVWDDFVSLVVSKNLAGVECLSGIPGTVGAAPVQNIGAYGQSAAASIERVWAINSDTTEEIVFENNDCEFGYRTSVFSAKGGKNPGNYILTKVSFLLKPNGAPTLIYQDLKNHFAGGASPTLQKTREAVLEIRSAKGMVVKGEELHSSAGSFFMNPAISEAALEGLKLKVARCKEMKNCCKDPWFWPRKDGLVKISAACLIECAGFEKGMKSGNVGISPLHSLAIVNYGGASAKEVLALSSEIQNKIKEKFGISLETEPQIV